MAEPALEQKGGNAFPVSRFMYATGDVLTEHHGRGSAEVCETATRPRAVLRLKDKAARLATSPRRSNVSAILQLSMGPDQGVTMLLKTIAWRPGEPYKEQQAKVRRGARPPRRSAKVVPAPKLKSDEEKRPPLGKKSMRAPEEGKPAPNPPTNAAAVVLYIPC